MPVKKYILIPFFIASLLLFHTMVYKAFGQVLVNNGGLIFSANDTIFVNGSVSNLADISGAGGTFSNSGDLYINSMGTDPGDWTNSAGNAAFTNAGGVDGASSITCHLMGGNQNITGNDITQFYTLRLSGTGVKQLNGVDAVVNNILDLNDRELATGPNRMTVTSTAPTAIEHIVGSGIVSSLQGGALLRNTASASRYLFPVGSSVGTFRYRPIEITPDDNFSNTYAVRMANVDATIEGFPVANRQATMSRVNDYYYHQITREVGLSSADITMYYDAFADGPVTGMAHWQNAPQWEDIMSDEDISNYGLTATTKQSWDFSSYPSPAFALMKLINECGEMFVPTAFSPDGNGENDMECVYGKCVKDIYFAIYDRWGEKVFETTSMSQCWDGTFRGKEMNTGVFVYYVKATLKTGEEVMKKGNITLLR